MAIASPEDMPRGFVVVHRGTGLIISKPFQTQSAARMWCGKCVHKPRDYRIQRERKDGD